MTDLFDEIRAACARVAAAATHVTIDHDRLAAYADELRPREPPTPPAPPPQDGSEERTAFVVALDTINFGSGWFPHLRKPAGLSGYRTVEAALTEHARSRPITGPWLRSLDSRTVAALLGQDAHGPAGELMGHYADALVTLGELVGERADDSFVDLVASAGGDPESMVRLLDRMPSFHDVHRHPSGPVPLYKRAQITVNDLAREFGGRGPGRFVGLERLTMFADNLVPHVLRIDGVVAFDPHLVARIERGDDITAGGPEEIEIRAVGLHAVELLVARMHTRGRVVTAAEVDSTLWERGSGRRYKAEPRHRSRCIFY